MAWNPNATFRKKERAAKYYGGAEQESFEQYVNAGRADLGLGAKYTVQAGATAADVADKVGGPENLPDRIVPGMVLRGRLGVKKTGSVSGGGTLAASTPRSKRMTGEEGEGLGGVYNPEGVSGVSSGDLGGSPSTAPYTGAIDTRRTGTANLRGANLGRVPTSNLGISTASVTGANEFATKQVQKKAQNVYEEEVKAGPFKGAAQFGNFIEQIATQNFNIKVTTPTEKKAFMDTLSYDQKFMVGVETAKQATIKAEALFGKDELKELDRLYANEESRLMRNGATQRKFVTVTNDLWDAMEEYVNAGGYAEDYLNQLPDHLKGLFANRWGYKLGFELGDADAGGGGSGGGGGGYGGYGGGRGGGGGEGGARSSFSSGAGVAGLINWRL